MTWEKLPSLETGGLRSGCLTCGPQPIAIGLDAVIAVGFGTAGVTRDGVEVWSEGSADDFGDCWTVQDAEDEALKDPDHDWRVFFHGPLSDATYQRHAAGQWVLIEKGLGFA
jgi:hypothetical protein